MGGFTGNQGQEVGGFTVDNWSESPLSVDKPRSGNRLGSPRNSFQQADGLYTFGGAALAAQWSRAVPRLFHERKLLCGRRDRGD